MSILPKIKERHYDLIFTWILQYIILIQMLFVTVNCKI